MNKLVHSFSSATRSAVFLAMLAACSPRYSYVEEAMPESIPLSRRLDALFAKTRLTCFGRFALAVPQEAKIIWGESYFPSRIHVIAEGEGDSRNLLKADIAKLLREDKTAEITYNGDGPIENSWQIRYFEGESEKKYDLHFFKTYVKKGEFIFVLSGSKRQHESESAAIAAQAARTRSLRLRSPDEVPTEPGYCIEHGFMASDRYEDQEMINVGIHIPSLPDVTFSVSSNKNAYGDYPPEEFEQRVRGELSLLARIKSAQDQQGIHYPNRTVLREGKRAVQHWHGEESLIRRPDGVHDFEWAFVGVPKDVANPSEYSVSMRTKVAHNMVGAAQAASLSDDEAVALWDKLLSGLKFRVKVPGAPNGSYHLVATEGEHQ